METSRIIFCITVITLFMSPDVWTIDIHKRDVAVTKYDPCEPYDPPVPDFSAPRRRISTTKCYEYIWNIKLRVERAKRERDCDTHNLDAQARNDVNITEETNLITRRKLIVGGHATLPGEFPHMVGLVYRKHAFFFLGELETCTMKPDRKIIGGRGVPVVDYPNMGAIGWKSVNKTEAWKFKCGSTLISSNFVITAAHCVKASSRDTTIADVVPKIVRFGVTDIIHFGSDRFPQDRDIIEIIVHPNYASPNKYFDISIMKLDEEIVFTKYVQPACLWNGPIEHFKEGIAIGWGVTNEDAYEGSTSLQAATLDIIDTKTCDVLLKPMCNRLWCGVKDHQFCAGKLAGGVDACQGDSGGPLQSRIHLPTRAEGSMHYVIGVTSFGIGCARQDVPGVYTKLSYFIDWIESIVW